MAAVRWRSETAEEEKRRENKMRAIYKKELKSYFTSAIAWVFLAFFLVLTGLFFFLYNLSGGSLNFSTVYGAIEIFFILLLIPVLTMKSMADEKHQKTDQLLYTSPISINKVVLGKYLALVTLFAIGLLIVSLYPIILQNLVRSVAEEGSTSYTVNYAVAYGSTLGFFLMGCAYIAIGVFVSSLTESQVIAAVAIGVINIFTMLMTSLANMLPSSKIFMICFFAALIVLLAFALNFWIHNKWVSALVGLVAEIVLFVLYFFFSSHFDGLLYNVLSAISFTDRYTNFTYGILDVSAMLYYVSVSFLFVFFTIQRIKKQRYN
jgi:ABC-2 type transport system permease protein